MALNLDGTTGITSDSGTPVIENLNTTATGIDITGQLTTTGAVGIGTSSPATKLHVEVSGASSIITNKGTSSNYYGYAGSTLVTQLLSSTTQTFLNSVADVPIIFGTNDTERMRIDSAGRVTMPYQPSFYVGRSGGSYFTNTVIIFNYFGDPGKHNTGNHYNTSTGLFTAPVAGRYMFHTRVIYESVGDGNSLTDAFHWYINGGTTGYSDRRAYYVNSVTGDGGYYTDTATILVSLNAGDTIGVYNAKNWVIHGNATYTFFSGFLIG